MTKLIVSTSNEESKNKIELIRNTVASTATESEFQMFMYLCNQWNLDPLKKEIYFTKFGNKVNMLISRDGYLKIANENPNFDGIESDVIYDEDIIERGSNGRIIIKYGPKHFKYDRNDLRGAFCNVYRKDRSVVTTANVSLRDHYKPNDIWKTYTHAMIMKVAESMALKRAFALSGLEELGDINEGE